MKATISIMKSFDNGKEFSKKWEQGDFEEFFKDEGAYLDKLSKITEENGQPNDGFVVTYAITVQV